MSRQPAWLKGDVVVAFRCGVMVMRSGEQWGYGDVYRVYTKRFMTDGTFEWRRDTRCFTREDAINEASRRVAFEEGYADAGLKKLWVTAVDRQARKPS